MRFFGSGLGVCWVLAIATAACGGNSDATDAGNNDDGGLAEAAPDAATAQPETYPAAHTSMPKMNYNGGRILANPKIVTITWAQDNATMVSRMQQFGDIITSTAWWTAVSSEYCQQPGNSPCIGQGSSGGHVVINDPPDATYTDSSGGGASTLQDFIKAHVLGTDAGAGDFPAFDSNTLYVLYFPPGVSITLDGEASCNSFGAYHNTAVIPDTNEIPTAVAYAVIPRCGTKESTTTVSASHEIIEAATDPDVGINALGYYMLNQTWTAGTGGEVGDLCESSGKSTTESTFTVQRTWSNKSAQAGNDPCVPIPSAEIYFNAAPQQQQIILPKQGATATVNIDAFSDAPLAPWTLTAVDTAAFQQGTSVLSFSFDKSTVQNGDHVVLTVTATGALPQGTDTFYIESQDTNKNRHSWPVLATSK